MRLTKDTATAIIAAIDEGTEGVVALVLEGGMSRFEAETVLKTGRREHRRGKKTLSAKVFLADEQGEARRMQKALKALEEIIQLGEDSPTTALRGAVEVLSKRAESRWGNRDMAKAQASLDAHVETALRALPRMVRIQVLGIWAHTNGLGSLAEKIREDFPELFEDIDLENA